MMFFLDIVKETNITGLKDWPQSSGHLFAIIFQPKFYGCIEDRAPSRTCCSGLYVICLMNNV